MATKSILKDIDIREKNMGRDFVNALENAKGKARKKIDYQKMCSNVKRSQIKAMFGAED